MPICSVMLATFVKMVSSDCQTVSSACMSVPIGLESYLPFVGLYTRGPMFEGDWSASRSMSALNSKS
jgi:hypothetical protein